MKNLRIVLLVAAVLSVLAVACGGGGSGSTSGEGTGTTGGGSTASLTSSSSSSSGATTVPAPTAEPPVASFSVDVQSGSAPLAVQFSDTSQGAATSVEWDFGDGTTSREASPSHRYTIAGSYDVQLKVTGPGGEDMDTQSSLIKIEPGPVASVVISPSDLFLGVEQSALLMAVAKDEFGNAVPSTFEFESDGAGGSITSDGFFTADTLAGTFTDAISALSSQVL